jgi:hypothetical protein
VAGNYEVPTSDFGLIAGISITDMASMGDPGGLHCCGELCHSTSRRCHAYQLSATRPACHNSCESCHVDENYEQTPNTCIECHQLTRPDSHPTGDCASCHTAISWSETIFNHEIDVSMNCVSCHEEQSPENHFPGSCGNCHTTQDWTEIIFIHSEEYSINCTDCHTNKPQISITSDMLQMP